MSYKIPENIKTLCAKESLKEPYEQELVKKEIVKYLKDYLNLKKGKNSLANVTGIVKDPFNCQGTNYPFERDIAGRMMRTRDYTMQEIVNSLGKQEVYVIASDRAWWDKYSFLVSLGLALFGFVLGLCSEPIRAKIFPKPTNSDPVLIRVLSMPQQQVSNSSQPSVQKNPAQTKMDSAKILH